MPAQQKSLRVLIIANACSWASWPDKIAAIKAFYAPLVDLQIDLKQEDFANIPLGTYPGTVTVFNGPNTTDVPGLDIEIDQDWFAEYVGPLFAGYDIVVFQSANVATTGLPLGIKFEKLNGTWCAETFIANEDYSYILPNPAGVGAGINLGNEAQIVIAHEISHALYSITGQPDRTHEFFYANNFNRVLTDLEFPSDSPLVKLLRELVATLLQEKQTIISQQSAADMESESTTLTEVNKVAGSPVVTGKSMTFPSMIVKWADAIKPEEGANPSLFNPGNLKFTTLTASWGATRGPAASDGGNLAQFETLAAGMFALCSFLQLGCEDELAAFHAVSPQGVPQPAARTLEGFTKIYAGGPPQGYIDAIVSALGVPADTQISSFLS